VGIAISSVPSFAPDVLQAHVYLAGAGAVLIARRTGVAVVVVVQHLGAFVEDTAELRQRLLAKMVYEGADLVCPVSVALGHRLAALAVAAAVYEPPPDGVSSAV
jgi:hypothetical protein